jgi:hypothetical protein
MSGLMQRILRRRDRGVHASQAPAHTEPVHAPRAGSPTPAATTPNGVAVHELGSPGGGPRAATPAGAEAATSAATADRVATPAGAEAATSAETATVPAAADGGAAPAGVDPAAGAGAGPSFRERGRLRRRLRFLRRLRELGFRDLGGLVFDQHRFGRPDDELVRGKLTALAAVDAELRALERALHDHVPITELREAGVSACAHCGAVIGSDARFCSACGAPASGVRAIPGVGGTTAAAPADEPSGASSPRAEPAAPQPPPASSAAPPADEQPTVVTRPGDRRPS